MRPTQDHDLMPCSQFAPLGLIVELVKQQSGQVLTHHLMILFCFQLFERFPKIPGKEMKSSSLGKDLLPKLLISPYDMFWNTNVSRGGLFSNMLCSCQ